MDRASLPPIPAALVAAALLLACAVAPAAHHEPDAGYAALVELFEEWRAFERPPLRDGAPDYTAATMAAQAEGLARLRARLQAIDPAGWPVEMQVDWHLVRAEMNGLDFNLRVLRPWARDPAYYASVWTYQSDTPAHEGPTHHALVELWTYDFPLSPEAEAKLAAELATIPPLLAQARLNLVGEARDLWVAGIGDLESQAETLGGLAEKTAAAGEELRAAVAAAREATLGFVEWLRQQAPSKTAPSGIGRDQYTWYLRNVHLVPLSWEEEVALLKRELHRAHASLRLEEHRNRDLPPLVAISTPEEYDRKANESVTRYLDFLEREGILTVRDYMDPALRARVGRFVPEEERNFFHTAIHYEPMTLWTHFYHWWDLARMEADPHESPVRRGPLLYNIFDSRAEGMATGVEEMMMHAGLYDDNPRVREIVWIMLAQRAARGLASLYLHANEFDLQDARDFHVRWTPRGWMREDLDLLGFEQLLYLRQPGYGTSYVTGKYLLERLLAARSEQLGSSFDLESFFEEVDAAGVIPVSLIHWQLTGDGEEVRAMAAGDG
ncbi:MAG: DUF885 family protein [Thermoanaerobaculia bacterium]|nr:DUF885 family protein [Thermoanaerobaculia bacterium]